MMVCTHAHTHTKKKQPLPLGLNNLLAAYKDKGATAVCTFALRPEKNGEIILFKGVTPV